MITYNDHLHRLPIMMVLRLPGPHVSGRQEVAVLIALGADLAGMTITVVIVIMIIMISSSSSRRKNIMSIVYVVIIIIGIMTVVALGADLVV